MNPREIWNIVANALRLGQRELEKGTMLARLLEKHRGVRNIANLALLTIPSILVRADAHHKRTVR